MQHKIAGRNTRKNEKWIKLRGTRKMKRDSGIANAEGGKSSRTRAEQAISRAEAAERYPKTSPFVRVHATKMEKSGEEQQPAERAPAGKKKMLQASVFVGYAASSLTTACFLRLEMLILVKHRQGQMDTDYLSRLNHAPPINTAMLTRADGRLPLGSTFGYGDIADSFTVNTNSWHQNNEQVKRLYDTFPMNLFSKRGSGLTHAGFLGEAAANENIRGQVLPLKVKKSRQSVKNPNKRRTRMNLRHNNQSALFNSFAKYLIKFGRKD
nr:DNA excision repair protein ERCC-1 [Ipomoea batatas]